MKKFEINEIQLIKNSFELRKKYSDNGHVNELNKIQSKLYFPVKNLTSLQKAIISGCVKEFTIYPNQDILNKSDYEILLLRKEIEKDCLKIDIASKILNKIKERTDSKRKLFKQTFEKIDKLSNSKEVYYSITKDGKIYKIGIVTGKNKGMKTELCSTSILSNFKIDFLTQDSFMKSGNPTELVNYLKRYGKENKLTENDSRFIKIMENASTQQV